MVIALALPAVAPACDVGKTSRASKRVPRQARAPFIVGDSTMLLATPYLGRKGIQADARGCRQMYAGVKLLAARRHARTLPSVVLLALGSNGPVSGSAIRKALRIIGRRRVLGLVTPRDAGHGPSSAMRRAARRFPHSVLLVDWQRYSSARGRGWFAGDGLHVTYNGAAAFASFVRRRLEPFIGPPRSLKVPSRATGARTCGRLRRNGRALDVLVVRGLARVTCGRARTLVARPPLRGIDHWRYYDWHRSGRRVWSDVYVREDRRAIVVARAPGRGPQA